jgi:poly-gamma-glutamate capsule biosynthesis protein CapA/YwtB (metallophosphatase superfamily)
MAIDQDTTTRDATLRPQTPAARQRNTEERERLREESRERRRARAEGRLIAPEPPGDEIKLSRLPAQDLEPEPPAPQPPAPAPRRAGPAPSTPAASRYAHTLPPQPAPAPPQPQAPRAPQPSRPPLQTRPRKPWLEPLQSARREIARQPWAEALRKSWPESLPKSLEDARRSARDVVARVATPRAPEREVPEAPQELDDLWAQPEALLEPAPADAPPWEPPAAPPRTADPDLPASPRERLLALVGIASAFAVVVALAATIGSGSLPGFGGGLDAHARGHARVIAPGGWVTLEGKHAPGSGKVILESRGRHENWHFFADGNADGDGDFAVRGRVLERPGRVELRARVPGGTATDPIAMTVRPLRLAAVGDVNLDGAPANAWQGVGHALRHADLSFANLESAVSTRGLPYLKQYNFRAKPAALAALSKRSGIDVLNLANNHVGDYGPGALMDTVKAVKRDGMTPVGAGANLAAATKPRIVHRLGLRIAFVGFSEIAPTDFAAAGNHPGTAWADPAQIARSVRAARSKADIVVATFHWGIEGQTLETAQQRALAQIAVQNGAQVVLGGHPHTLQPVRRQGGAIVAYSLGNFVFDGQSDPTTTTGILQLGLTADGVTSARWRAAHIASGRPLLTARKAKPLPLRDGLRMQAGVNLPQL